MDTKDAVCSRMQFLHFALPVLFLLLGTFHAESAAPSRPPNILLILADDLGYGELGCYGQDKILTPNLDRLAAEGIRFTRFYAGASVCAPSRSVLMTGQHVGRTRVRGNTFPEDNGRQELLPEDVTVAEVLKKAGYATAMIGKWGLGMPGTGGHPNRQGFDYFFGYLSQHHAHNYYPAFLWRNEEKVLLPNVVTPAGQGRIFGAGIATERKVYAPDWFVEEALRFVEANRDRPFFLYYATVVPHSNNEATRIARADGAEVPDLGPYADKPWDLGARRHAAMVTRMDADIGRILARLQALGLRDNTLVVFTSDNGPHPDHVEPPEFFRPAGPLRGRKGQLWEGGIRVPCIIRWPQQIRKPLVSDHPAYFGDFLATFAALAGQPVPEPNNSISLLPTLTGQAGRQPRHEWLYWEMSAIDVGQVVLLDGRWKGILRRRAGNSIFALYDLDNDLGEATNVADQHTELAARIRELIANARSENPNWPLRK